MTVLATQAVTMAELKFVITTQLELGRNFVKMDIVFDALNLGVTALKGIFAVSCHRESCINGKCQTTPTKAPVKSILD